MEQFALEPVCSESIPALALMAEEIWTEHYTPLIGEDQVAYMVKSFQSPPALQKQLAQEAYRYFFLLCGGERAGYMGIQPKDGGLYLSKLYVRKSFRGKHLAAKALDFLKQLCREEGFPHIWLTVNRGNSGSISAYQRLGFHLEREQAADIGGGFVMDDYVYKMELIKE